MRYNKEEIHIYHYIHQVKEVDINDLVFNCNHTCLNPKICNKSSECYCCMGTKEIRASAKA